MLKLINGKFPFGCGMSPHLDRHSPVAYLFAFITFGCSVMLLWLWSEIHPPDDITFIDPFQEMLLQGGGGRRGGRGSRGGGGGHDGDVVEAALLQDCGRQGGGGG